MGLMTWTLDAEHPLGDELLIRRYVWPNGLRVVVLADRSAPIFSYQTWLRVGSRSERPGQTGMAHFFEHLMFGETETQAQGGFDSLIEGRGGDNNAATWTDWTFYRTSLPAADLELAVRLESDRMARLVLEDDQIETEREVVINERKERVDDDVDGFLDENLYKHAFTTHPYRWPTIGWMDDIRGLAKPEIQKFYRTYYAPNNTTLVLVGDVDEPSALDLIARYYGDMPASSVPEEPVSAEPDQTEPRQLTFAKPVTADRLVVGYKVPGQAHPDWAVIEFIAAVLCGGPSSRLYRRLVIDTEIATSVDCGVPPFRDPCLFRIGVNLTREHRADKALVEIDAALSELATTPVPDRELTKIKNGVETDFWSAMEGVDGRAEALGHYETTLGDFRELFAIGDRIGAITADDITRVARAYLTPPRRTVVIAEPQEPEKTT